MSWCVFGLFSTNYGLWMCCGNALVPYFVCSSMCRLNIRETSSEPSFSLQGTNAHVILESGQSLVERSAERSQWRRQRLWSAPRLHSMICRVTVATKSVIQLEAQLWKASSAMLWDHRCALEYWKNSCRTIAQPHANLLFYCMLYLIDAVIGLSKRPDSFSLNQSINASILLYWGFKTGRETNLCFAGFLAKRCALAPACWN